MTATLSTRQRLIDFVNALDDEGVEALARQVLPLPPPPARLEVADDGTYPDFEGEPLVFTEAEGRARLEAAVASLKAGEKAIPWEEVKARMRARQAARVQR